MSVACISQISGDLLGAQCVEAIVNPVNCVGVAGKGLAAQFKKAWPANYRAYVAACKRGEIVPGKCFVFETYETGVLPRFVINFPTKQYWKQPSRLDYIESGMVSLVAALHHYKLSSIAIPRLGCGLGRLNWNEVEPIVVRALLSGCESFTHTPSIFVYLYVG